MAVASLPRPTTTAPPPKMLLYEPRGAARGLFYNRIGEALMSGPAGTGKSRACLEKLHLCALKWPGMRGLILRKTRESLTEAALVTFETKVLPPNSPIAAGNLRRVRQSYSYPNGSEIVVGGLDKPGKVMSTEYDMVYIQEATEVGEPEWESVTTRLRNGVMPFQQVMADANPDAPRHWLKVRADRGGVQMLESRHEDNPELWDREAGAWTERGRAYIAKLDALTGVRKLRLRHGIWAAAEGLVYEAWDPAVHLVDRFPIPPEWPRYWSIDFGFTNPFCWQDWAQDPDGRLYLVQEIYRTQRLVEDHAVDILAATKDEPKPRAIVCDHDAEGRATLERKLGMKTTAATKAVTSGIQAVSARLRPADDGKPRLFIFRGALVERDRSRDEAKRTACTQEEFDSYVWDTSSNRRSGEEPVKVDDHGMDAKRYLVMHVDAPRRTWGVAG